MGIINRFLCFLFSLTVLVVAICVLLVVCGVITENFFFNNLSYLLRQAEAPAVVGTVILFAFYFGCLSLFSGEKKEPPLKELTLDKTDGGQINVTVEAVKNLVERTALGTDGVREVTAYVSAEKSGGAGLKIKLDLSVLADANVPTVSAGVIAAVKNELNVALSVNDANIAVSTSEISNTGGNKRVV